MIDQESLLTYTWIVLPVILEPQLLNLPFQSITLALWNEYLQKTTEDFHAC